MSHLGPMGQMEKIEEGSILWQYLSREERDLASDGAFLIEDSARHADQEPTDYSYLVFPFAKLYEGFLKDLFLDLGIISQRDYYSNHYRIGKALSPNLLRRLGNRSAYGQLAKQFGDGLAVMLWHAWKEGRNLVFHYYPHNLKALTRTGAIELVSMIVRAMEDGVRVTREFRTRKSTNKQIYK
ncbi:hypothetical protein HY087_01105 [Candidatus Gottesmanbacteria bacterium]|nr:hypothetical protein [Candidatus Gottesmanbacteria bacterium]